jgi:hypothetical protein
MEIEINIPGVVAEVAAAFRRYENAYLSNDVSVLNQLFWHGPNTVRFGTGENSYGYDRIADYRTTRSPIGSRSLQNTVITTFGRDFATASTEFRREGNPRTGRQQQSWVRFPEGWRIVAAHVSMIY